MRHILNTGQTRCYDSKGQKTSCHGSGHDGETQTGIFWPTDRFTVQNEVVVDHLTDLVWIRNANISTFPCTWQESYERITELNQQQYGTYNDWRLPNRNELRILVSYQAKNPALPEGHPFINIFLGWYWTSTTAAIHPAYAWSIHLEGARMFYGSKVQYQLFWPVRGTGNTHLPATGQLRCYDVSGNMTVCSGSGQDGALRLGSDWPQPRFITQADIIHDQLTGLGWARHSNVTGDPVNWQQALDAVSDVNKKGLGGIQQWRLPTINELASLTDCNTHSPALPKEHPFIGMQDGYWSSTTSFFETDWAWVLYLDKGACGVGHKPGKTFFVWPVTTLEHADLFHNEGLAKKP